MKIKALKAAFPHTVPIAVGFLFLGMSYGFYMKSMGFSALIPILMSIFIYAGSMQFVTVDLLLGGFNPVSAFLLTLMVNARHLFYGISMLQKYKNTGLKKPYLIFGMSDETFTVNCAVTAPEGVDSGWFMFFITLLNQAYWVAGTTLGALLGFFVRFNTKGIEFVMTALFAVMFVEQWEKSADKKPALIGVGASVLCLFIFGSKSFILPAMVLIILCFALSGFKREAGK